MNGIQIELDLLLTLVEYVGIDLVEDFEFVQGVFESVTGVRVELNSPLTIAEDTVLDLVETFEFE